MVNEVISFKEASFQYHSQASPTLKGINLKVNQGEKLLVIGSSGSGKSTFGNCLNGLIPNIYKGELTGEVYINGHNIKETDLFELSFQVGTVLQDTDSQFIGLTVGEDIAFSLENDNVATKEMHQQVEKWLKEVDLVNYESHKPQDLSGGQKQRVSMAGVLVDDSPILLFDEPLANLDPQAGLEAMELIEKIHQKTNATIVIIEHRLEDVLHIPMDRVILFDEGEIIVDTTPDSLLRGDLLEKYGIREPLYLTAMKYAKVPLEKIEKVDQLSSLNAEIIKPLVDQWSLEHDESMKETNNLDLLNLNQINYEYVNSNKKVLNDISVSFKKGEMISLVGKNGAGKSTLAKAICGFVKSSGQMTWQNDNMENLSIKERADRIGYVMQNPNQMISKKMIREEVALGLELRGLPEEVIQEKVEAVLKTCGLYPFRNWPISALSYGQKKRVTIASILVLEPEMLILDEPTAGQDYRHYTEIMNFLEKINQTGMTVVMITHDMHLMIEYTKRCLVLTDGKIVADTSPVDVLTNGTLVKSANLKETNLFTFAKKIGIEEPVSFVNKFITYDREVRNK
ncbi:ABC transporter ATP-binding protein [Vagococcus hydrophili]|uniref:ABC transporter ATP-binding protein n=1 Tax=Vagococcus hydrophili TaxID=2714947 RepID=A0A6G8AWZ1_9ENTE|nr:ABC transporter ATP-binding protein [Vagococcus hydrophili]QIL49479.1 ABC transporter ATP-binding protein [Vagococcus hydrophili]